MKKEILKLQEKAAKMQTTKDIREELGYYKISFYKTLNKQQQTDFKQICDCYEKLLEREINDAFSDGVCSAITTNAEEDYQNFVKAQEKSIDNI